MEATKNEAEFTGSVLFRLREILSQFDDHQDHNLLAHDGLWRPAETGASFPGEIFKIFGIHGSAFTSAIPDIRPNLTTLSDGGGVMPRWHDFKQKTNFIEALKNLFSNTRIVPFSDWSNVSHGSDLWYGLLSDVIKPLGRKDFQFIFYLGDPTDKLFFEIDEILDIISEFSHYGSVTFALDHQEAAKLWAFLNGESSDDKFFDADSTVAMTKYLSLFNTMDIENLVVYSQNQALLISNETNFKILRNAPQFAGTQKEDRENFIAGYCFGLRHQLDIAQCIALGIIVSEVYLENNGNPDRQTLITHIEKWMAALPALRQ